MSLEAAIAKLTEAVEANTAALKSGAAKPPARTSGSKSTGKPPAKKEKEITVDDLAEAFGQHMKKNQKADREAAKEQVMAIIEHFGVERITGLKEEQYAEALSLLRSYQNGSDPLGGGEDEEDSMI